jgi:hypothetical protein
MPLAFSIPLNSKLGFLFICLQQQETCFSLLLLFYSILPFLFLILREERKAG